MHLPVRIIKNNYEITNTIHTNPDPYMIRWRNCYYCYSSGEKGIKILYSKDLKSFTEHDYTYNNERECSFWAPSIFEWKGQFYLYYSSLRKGETDDHLHFLRVAVADNPLGPFIYRETLTNYFCIDPHVIKSKGRIYIFYAANIYDNEKNNRIGTSIWLDELVTPFKLADKAKTVLFPSIDQEIYSRNRFGDGKDWHTLEGPYYLSDGESSWLMYSGNAYTSPDYFVGYAHGQNGNDLLHMDWEKYPSEKEYMPLVRAKNGIEGPGHNSITQAPDHITPIIVYHGRKQGGKTDATVDDRELYIDYLWREDEELRTDAPSREEIDDFPYPDISYLKELMVTAGDNYKGEDILISEDFKIKLPKKQFFYIEMCILPISESISIFTSEVQEEALITLEGNFWQRIGILFTNGTVRLRDNEEWKKPILCETPFNLFFRLNGRAKFQYLDCTFLQTGCGIPSCLL